MVGESDDEGDDDDVDNSDAMFQYEWCGQTRVRVTAYMHATGQLYCKYSFCFNNFATEYRYLEIK